MRKKKLSQPLFECSNPLLTEPNKAMTPRQILSQYAQGLQLRQYESSDDIDDERYDDDDMVDRVVVFEDEMDARQFMNGITVIKENEQTESKSSGQQETSESVESSPEPTE